VSKDDRSPIPPSVFKAIRRAALREDTSEEERAIEAARPQKCKTCGECACSLCDAELGPCQCSDRGLERSP
jgi:hypothetical protein